MSTLTSDTVADFDSLDPRLNAGVSRVERDVWGRIKGDIGMTHDELEKLIKKPRKEARQISAENAEHYQPEAIEAAALRAGVSEEALRQRGNDVILPYSVSIAGNGMGMTPPYPSPLIPIDVNVSFDVTCPALTLDSEDQIKHFLWKFTPAELLTMGVHITPVAGIFSEFTEQQCADLAHKLWGVILPFRGLQKSFRANGVSEANVQVAMELARHMPFDAVVALGKNVGEVEKEIEKTKGQSSLIQALHDLEGVSEESQNEDYSKVLDEQGKIQQDLTVLRAIVAPAIVAPQSEIAQRLSSAGTNLFTLVSSRKNKMIQSLSEEMARLEKERRHYDKAKTAIQRVYDQAKRAGENTDLDGYIDAGGKVKDVELKTSTNPKTLADKWRSDFKLASKEDCAAKLVKLEQEKKDIMEGKKALSGREAVLAVYQKHFEQNENMPPDQARRAAHELFGRNAVGREEVEVQKHLINETPQVVPEMRQGWLYDHFKQEEWRSLKELALGREESFLCNIVESPQVGMNAAGTRRWWLLWASHKHKARPPWGRANYPQLVTSYFAIRDAARKGHLQSSDYVRGQLSELSHLLVSHYSRNLVRDFDSAPITDEQRQELESLSESERSQRQIRLLLTGEVPPMYASDVSGAIEYAAGQTAWKRRLAGRVAKGTVVQTVKWGAVKPVKLAGKTIAWPFRKIAGLARSFHEYMSQKDTIF
ncbi:MAG: hypothetical protein PHI23_05145 [Candidatus Peribacteraceae bacterium]|nr:hypothetical protein [Candidatus Peribacteraceae bacterium]